MIVFNGDFVDRSVQIHATQNVVLIDQGQLVYRGCFDSVCVQMAVPTPSLPQQR